MRGAPQLEHHIVGNVHQRRDAALATARQALDHPGRRLHARVDATHHPAAEAPAQVAGLHIDRQAVLQRHRRGCKCGLLQRRTGQGRHFARNAVDAQAVRQIGRELQREQHVVQTQLLADVAAHHRVVGEFEQTTALFRDLQFLGRTQHALALNATQLAELDGKRLAVFTGRQHRAHRGTRHLDAGTRVGCATDDVQWGALPDVDLAHAQAVGVRVLLGAQDLAHHHTGEGRRDRVQLFDLQTGHGQGVGQLLAGQGRIAEGAQPGFGKLHGRLGWARRYGLKNTAEPASPGCRCCPLSGGDAKRRGGVHFLAGVT